MQTALRSEHAVLNSVYPQLNVADNKTNCCIDEVSSDDDEYKDEDDDVNDNHNHIDTLLLNGAEYGESEAACKLEKNKKQLGLCTEPQTPRKTRARCGQCRLDDCGSIGRLRPAHRHMSVACHMQVGDWVT